MVDRRGLSRSLPSQSWTSPSLFGKIVGRGPIACWFQRTLFKNRAGKEARASRRVHPDFVEKSAPHPLIERSKCLSGFSLRLDFRQKQSSGLGGDPSFCLHHLCTAMIFKTCVFWSSKEYEFVHTIYYSCKDPKKKKEHIISLKKRPHRIYKKIGTTSIHSQFFGQLVHSLLKKWTSSHWNVAEEAIGRPALITITTSSLLI